MGQRRTAQARYFLFPGLNPLRCFGGFNSSKSLCLPFLEALAPP